MNKDSYMSALNLMDEVMEPAPRIKVTEVDIIVERIGKDKKPYFEIKYREVGKLDCTIGFGSYSLKNVFKWLDECFEIVKETQMQSPKEIAFDIILNQLIKDKIRYENMEDSIARCVAEYLDCYIDYMYEILYM